MLRLSILVALLVALAAAPAASAQDDGSGLYAPFPEPAEGTGLGPLGLAGAPRAGGGTRPLRQAVGGAGPASVRAGTAPGIPSPLPAAGLLVPLLVVVAVGGHVWSRRRRAEAG